MTETNRPNPSTQEEIEALSGALAVFTETSRRMEEAYRGLQQRFAALDQELAQKNHELALTSDYLSNLLESMSDGVVAVNGEGVITNFNRAASAILGYDSGEVTGQAFEAVFQRPFEAPPNPLEMALSSRDGRTVPVNERDAMIADREGKGLGWVKTFQDLSEIHALREQMRQRERLAAIGEMAATVAHEIRNPLGGIRGFAALLAQDLPPEDPRRRLVDKILLGTQNLDKVVGELLEYTRPVEVQLRPVSCRSIVASACAFLDYDDRRIAIECPEDTDYRVYADAEKIRQVLLNLLLNAVQSIEGEGRVTVSIRTEGQGHVALLVRDTGCGVPDEHLEDIFSPFFTTKQKGTGLGLAVCRKIIEVHGGRIFAESQEGTGTAFTVILPRAG